MFAKKEIDRNELKTRLLIVAFMAVIGCVGAALEYVFRGSIGWWTLVFMGVAGLYAWFVTVRGDRVILSRNHAVKVEDPEDHPELFGVVEGVSKAAGIEMPEVYIIEDEGMNAFAAGVRRENAKVVVTRGLLERLGKRELTAVIAHEIAHVKNNDVRLMTVLMGLLLILVFIADYSVYVLAAGKRNVWLLLLSFVVLLAAPLVGFFVKMMVSRSQEYLADAEAVEMTADPLGMARALVEISSDERKVESASASASAFYFTDPKKEKVAWTSTHPTIRERVRRLGYEMEDLVEFMEIEGEEGRREMGARTR